MKIKDLNSETQSHVFQILGRINLYKHMSCQEILQLELHTLFSDMNEYTQKVQAIARLSKDL